MSSSPSLSSSNNVNHINGGGLANKKVLSIQSHVVHGYVGNKSATFPLQLLGFEVDAINSVQLSNHTGYKHVKGQILNKNDLNVVAAGLEENDLLRHYTHLLTGYIGDASFLREIAKIVTKLKRLNPNLIYVCDTVMGDNGVMYVPKELLPIYRDEIVPLADVITPNQFELELLMDCKINTPNEIWTYIQQLHEKGVKTVAVSSTNLGKEGELIAFLSNNKGAKYTLTIPMQGHGITFTGTGDLFAALYLAYSYDKDDPGEAFEYTINTLQSIIKKTLDNMPGKVQNGQRMPTAFERELKLIQSKKEIENPQITLKVKSH